MIQRRLGMYFKELQEGEREVEVARQVLAEQSQFDPYALFLNLDRYGKGFLSGTDLIRYTKEKNILARPEDCFGLIRTYDTSKKNKLCYSDFINFVLPATNTEIRKIVEGRKTKSLKEVLHYPEEYGFTKVLARELKLQQVLRILREDLKNTPPYSIIPLFGLISPPHSHSITESDIKNFMLSIGIQLRKEEAEAVLRRLDCDRDGRVSYLDFLDSMLPFEKIETESRIPATEPRKPGHSFSPEFHSVFKEKPEFSSLDRVPLESRPVERSSEPQLRIRRPEDEFRPFSITKVNTEKKEKQEPISVVEEEKKSELKSQEDSQESIPLRNEEVIDLPRQIPEPVDANLSPVPKKLRAREIEEEMYVTPEKRRDKMIENQTTGDTPLQIESTKKIQKGRDSLIPLIQIMSQQLALEKNIEEAKTNICTEMDYTFSGVFSFFDTKNEGSVSLYELRQGFARLGLYRSSKDLMCLMRQYDQDCDGILSQREFESMLFPSSRAYTALVTRRSPKKSAFSRETQQKLLQLFDLLVETEVIIEKLRQKEQGSPMSFTIQEVFDTVDLFSTGFIEPARLKETLNSQKNMFTDTDIEIIMKRYDKDRDGKISLMEFLRELISSPRTFEDF